ncbi:MAG: alpha/beta hydrolase [Ignavibacteriaceae bacterium]
MCKLDIYYPSDKEDFYTIVWFHGGGLTGGSKEIPEDLKNNGYAVVGAGYRLSPSVNSPLYIEDAASAIAWVFNNIEKYGGKKSKIIISGFSAGGYLSLMCGLDKKYLKKYDIDADSLFAIIPCSGQTITHFTIRRERGIPENQAVVDSLAPLFWTREDAPPLFLITGDRELELYGRYEENAYLKRMMKLSGHEKTELYELDGFNHGEMLEPALKLINKIIRQFN